MRPFNWRSTKSIDKAAIEEAREDFFDYPDERGGGDDSEFFWNVEAYINGQRPERAKWDEEKVNAAALRFVNTYDDEMMRLGRLYDAIAEEAEARGGSVTSREAAARALRIDATLYDAVEKAARARGEYPGPGEIAARVLQIDAAQKAAAPGARKANRAQARRRR